MKSTSTQAAEEVLESLETDAIDAARDVIQRAAQHYPTDPELYVKRVIQQLQEAAKKGVEYG